MKLTMIQSLKSAVAGGLLFAGGVMLSACGGGSDSSDVLLVGPNGLSFAERQAMEEEVLEHYADMAHAMYADSLDKALALHDAIDTLVASPSETSLENAREAWIDARPAYQQSEVLRFDEGFVSQGVAPEIGGSVDGWEGQVNAWPLDEGFIDYVSGDYEGDTTNIIASTGIIDPAGANVDVTTLETDDLINLNEAFDSEANVASGIHAIEFLLWGQDLHGTSAGAGERPVSDYLQEELCTNDHCERRGEYLQLAADLLVTDLENMVAQWDSETPGTTLRRDFLERGVQNGIQRILFGMGSLALGELASERMNVALLAESPEDEHDCFSDNTHNSYFYNALGVKVMYTGAYGRSNGSVLTGTAIGDVVQAVRPDLHQQALEDLAAVESAMQVIVDTAEDEGQHFDQMIVDASPNGGKQKISDGIEALANFTETLETIAAEVFGITNLDSDCGSTLCG